ncbi:hypothetical protein [Pedobacter sp. SYSU D00535]|uniref:hypothetical protein n=1 Tax=Pedobacter sp. SYSU D00535 TaxID=2810308 RepID=UPI001A9624F6|nr:hypothetical protein [Pedobacter sp. SYSU D00535]
MKRISFYILASILFSACGRSDRPATGSDSSAVKKLDTSEAYTPSVNPDTTRSNMPVLEDTINDVPKY